MKKLVVICAMGVIGLGAFASTSISAEKQNPTPPPATTTQQPPAPQPSAATPAVQAGAQQTLVGCLYREKDVPGREPNVAERAGVLEDYILADASMNGQTPAAGKMYKVEKIDDDQLKQHVGKKVEIVGRIDAEPSDVAPASTGGAPMPKPDKGPGPDAIELPEFEAVSIRVIEGTCPAKPVQ